MRPHPSSLPGPAPPPSSSFPPASLSLLSPLSGCLLFLSSPSPRAHSSLSSALHLLLLLLLLLPPACALPALPSPGSRPVPGPAPLPRLPVPGVPPPPSSLPAAAPPLPPRLALALPLATPAPEPGSDAPRRCQPLSPGGRGGGSSGSSWSGGAVTTAHPVHSPSPTASLRLASCPGTESSPDPRDPAVSGPPVAAPLLPPLPPAVELRLGGRGTGGFRGGGRGGASCARVGKGDAGKRLRPGRSGLGRGGG